MGNDKPRLSVSEVKQLIDQIKCYGGSYQMMFNNCSYGIDDVYNQYIYNQDALMHVLDEVLLKKGRF